MTSLTWEGLGQCQEHKPFRIFISKGWIVFKVFNDNVPLLTNGHVLWDAIRSLQGSPNFQKARIPIGKFTNLIHAEEILNGHSACDARDVTNTCGDPDSFSFNVCFAHIEKYVTRKCARWASSYQKCCNQFSHGYDNRCAPPQIKWGLT